MKNKKTMGLVAITALIVGVTALVAGASVDAKMGQGNSKQNRFTDEQKTQLDTAITNQDYTAWKSIIGEDAKIVEKINETNFSRFSEMHGHIKKAKEIGKELGLDQLRKNKLGMHAKFKKFNRQNPEAKQAVEAKDYTAWKTAVGTDAKMLEIIDSSEKFDKLVLMHKYIQEGEHDKAMEIKKELKMPMGKGQFNKTNNVQ